MREVHLVLDQDDMVMAVFAGEQDANDFIKAVGKGEGEPAEFWEVSTREVHYGQPSNPGYNR